MYTALSTTSSESDDSGGKGAKESRSLQQIIDTQPDIVCMQEGYNPNYRFKLQMDTINKIYPYSNFIPEGGEIIFSKYPLKSSLLHSPHGIQPIIPHTNLMWTGIRCSL